jgi:hypothetical protein
VAEAPDFRGGYAGEPTAPGGGGYDPFAPQNYTGPVAPDFRGGYNGEATFAGGGGFDPASIRDTGSAAEARKPDGTPVITGVTPSNVSVGSAAVTTGAIPTSPFGTTEAASVVPSILQSQPNTTSLSADAQLAIIPNPLELFASYTPLWTLACLEAEQYNNPESYRNSPADLKHIVMSSAGRYDSQRVQTSSGVPEFYINNFIMTSGIGSNEKSGNSNVFTFEWDVYEPYSMGLLLQSLQIAAKNAGFVNYLNDAVFVLRLDFQGYDELGRNYAVIKPKFFTLRITKTTFQVNEGGSSYKMIAVPYNHIGFSDTINTSYNDIKIVPNKSGTVEEALADMSSNSLVAALNKIEQDLLDAQKIGFKDVYEIQFPNSSEEFQRIEETNKTLAATVIPGANTAGLTVQGTNIKTNPVSFESNPIGKSEFGFNQNQGGNYPFRKHSETVDANGLITRDNMTINPKTRTLQFSQGQTITAIINSIIINSDYAKNALDPKNIINGYIKWFKIDVQVELLQYDPLVGDFAKKFTYRIVPYLTHESLFTNPSNVPDYKDVKKKIVKGYNYIYTGQNVDVLKFDIEINHLFYTGVQPSNELKTAQQTNPDQASGTGEVEKQKAKSGKGAATLAAVASGGRSRPMRNPDALKEKEFTGGAGIQDTAQKVAQAFHKAFTDSTTELIKVNLEILGDPYWIVDSGMGNYFAKPSPVNSQVTEDGTMNYESGDVYVYLTFRTPSDVNTATGLYNFSKETTVSPYSGVYRVAKCESMFNEMFTQRLALIRMPGQALDYVDNPTSVQESVRQDDKEQSLATVLGENEPTRITITDPIVPSILVSTRQITPSNANGVPGSAAITETPGQTAPDFRGGYVPGSSTVASGGGYDPATNTFTSNSANSIGGSSAISAAGNIAPSFAGGFVAGPTVASGGGFDPTTGTNTSNSANSTGGSRAIT